MVDVSFAKTHYENEEECGIMGKGAMIALLRPFHERCQIALLALQKKRAYHISLEVMKRKNRYGSWNG